MRWVLITMIILGVALIALSLLGQTGAFYFWHDAEIELRRVAAQFGESAQRNIETVAFQHQPRPTYWFAIRLAGVAVIVTAAVGLWLQRRRV
jgi:hypothetical protein